MFALTQVSFFVRKIAATILNPVDSFLNSLTMYRVVVNSLLVMSFWAIILISTGHISHSISAVGISLSIFVIGIFLFNVILGKLFSATINMESSVITGLILFLIFSPPNSTKDIYMIVAAASIATASKYIFAIKKKHLFNPAAIAAFAVPLLGFDGASWWVATPLMAPLIVFFGLLVVRKIRRFSLFFAFSLAAIVSIFLTNFSFLNSGFMSYSQLFSEILLSWPLLFFGTIMLTEPYTMPHKRNLQILFGMLVGILFGARFHIGPFFSTPETALIIGNIFAYLVSPKMKLFLTLQKKVKLSSTMYHFYFSKPPHFNFEAGQYMEWTLPLETSIQSDKNQFPDSRGNRRFFTIASAPSEATLQLGVKILETKDNPSFFKQALAALKPGDSIVASQLGGDFTVPKNISHYSHIVFIAGGIGITPFRSMIEELGTANKISANSSIPNITLFYCSSYQDEFIYQDTFENKKSSSFLKPVYVLTRPENVTKDWELKQAQSNICKSGPAYEAGRLNQAKLKKYVPQPEACLYYLSGPNVMVEAYKSVLLQMNVPHTAIKTDYFPGF